MADEKEVCICAFPSPQVHIRPDQTIAYYCKRCLRTYIRKPKK